MLLLRRSLAVAFLALPSLAADRLLVAGYGFDQVASFDAATGAPLHAFAPAGLDGVLGVAVGPDGHVYVCSELTDRVLRFDGDTGAFLGPFVFDDPSTPANETGGLDSPSGIVFGKDERAYVASFTQNRILRYDARTGAFVDVFVAAASSGSLSGPDAGMSFGPGPGGGDLFVPAYFNSAIKRYSGSSGAFLGNFATATAGIIRPRMIAFPGDGFAYVASETNDRIVQLDAGTGAFVRNVVVDDPSTPANETGGLDAPSALAFGPDGRLYVASLGTDSVLRYDMPSGQFVDVFVPAGSGGLTQPTFVLFRPDARVYGAPTPSSAGAGATLVAYGFASVAADELAFELHFAPPNEPCVLFAGDASADLPFGDGRLLVDPRPIARLGRGTSDARGALRFPLRWPQALAAHPPFTPGTSSFVQAYVRDFASAGAGFNASTAVELRVRP